MSSIKEAIAAAKSAPAFFSKNSKPGDTVTLRITALDMRQTRDEKNKPESWEDGSPKKQIVITGDNLNFEVEGTKGNAVPAYTVYIKWWGNQRRAFATACDAADIDEPLPGDVLVITYTGDGEKPANKMLSPEKLFAYELGRGPR